MKRNYLITSNTQIAKDIYRLTLSGDTVGLDKPGQFVNLRLNAFFLRRPISVCDVSDGVLTLVYKIFGSGTAYLSTLREGASLELLTGLGNGFDVEKSGQSPLLIGGGVGVPPLYLLAKKLIGLGRVPKVLLGFGSAGEVFFKEEFAALGCEVRITTIDGSEGKKGLVTDALGWIDYDYVFCCGPKPMLQAVLAECVADGQFSMEERMACGIGACMGCICETKEGNKRVCKEGPVFYKSELI